MAYKKGYKKGYKKSYPKKQAKWKQILKLGQAMYSDIKGPLGYAIRGVNRFKNMINTEVKYIGGTKGPTVITSSGQIDSLSFVGQGLTDTTRIGNSILAKHLTIRHNMTVSAIDPAGLLRTIVFIDKNNNNGTAPAVSDVLTSQDISSMANINNLDRFVILRDSTVSLTVGGVAKSYYKDYIDLSRLHIKFDGINATQADAAEHHIYVLRISDVPTNGPTSTFNPRVAFYDN